MNELESQPRDALWRWIWVVAFAIAFAWVESAVVVYLREIYYGGDFQFPIRIHWREGAIVFDHMSYIELGREIATMLMLVAVGCLAGRSYWQKFSFFMIAFGIWDIFFYLWLWVMIRWPGSLLTWDLLFLIPLPWVGPVVAPALIALAMAGAGSLIVYFDDRGLRIAWRWFDWVIILGCGLLMIISFCLDWRNVLQVPAEPPHSGVPNPFAWWLYLPAYVLSVVYFLARMSGSVRERKA
jgi:hypothetical protein